MAKVNGHPVPDTESEAQKGGWRPMPPAFAPQGMRPDTTPFRGDCQKLPQGALCDAFVRLDGKVQATYCDGNHQCSRSYESP
jgi:hypothetical protein